MPPESLPLFRSHDVLTLTLRGDLKGLRRDRDDDAEERDAELIVHGPDGSDVTLTAQIRPRGKFRRQKRICAFPNIRLNLKTKEVVGTVFEGQDKLKMVCHCQDKRAEYEQYGLQEYLIYRMYNVLTDASYRVRLAHVTYIDTGGSSDTVVKYAFLIEDDDHLAARHGMAVLEREGIHPDQMDRDRLTLLSVFQYMIGNTDWSAPYGHNTTLIMDAKQVPVAVPYDFDWSGLIAPPYARPDATLPIRSVRERLFRGFCDSPESFARVFAHFTDRRDAISALVREQPGLDEKHVKKSIEYLDGFYDVITDPGRARRDIIERCRGVP